MVMVCVDISSLKGGFAAQTDWLSALLYIYQMNSGKYSNGCASTTAQLLLFITTSAKKQVIFSGLSVSLFVRLLDYSKSSG